MTKEAQLTIEDIRCNFLRIEANFDFHLNDDCRHPAKEIKQKLLGKGVFGDKLTF